MSIRIHFSDGTTDLFRDIYHIYADEQVVKVYDLATDKQSFIPLHSVKRIEQL